MCSYNTKHLLTLLFFLFSYAYLSTFSLAQESNTPVIIGQYHLIKSAILEEDRHIQIYTPNGYSETNKQYPTLYIIDGQLFFTSGVAIQTAVQSPRAIPEMIVIGINTSDSQRYTLLGEESEKFTTFLIDEVVDFVDSNYRTSDERIVFGWESAAYYLSNLILQDSQIFDGAILTNGGYAAADAVRSMSAEDDVYLFMANTAKDIYNIENTDQFYEILKNNAPKNLVWDYRLYNDEIHESLAHLAMYQGLKYFYHNHNSLVFESIQEYIDLGGYDYLQSYFQGRGKRFGFDDKIDDSTKNSLIWLAWKRDNFEHFDLFMRKFEDVLSTPRYSSAYWQNRFGQFYLKHDDYENAIKHFKVGLSQYPNSRFEVQMQKGLAAAQDRSNK